MKLDPLSIEFKQLQKKNMKYIKALRRRATKAEIVFRDFLREKGVYHKFQKGFFRPFHRIVDFYIPRIQYIIEIDGDIHDYLIEKDINKDTSFLNNRGFQTIRISNEEVFCGSFRYRTDIIKMVETAPRGPRTRESRCRI